MSANGTRSRRVVVTGMGAVSPAGVGVEALWRAAREGDPCGERIAKFDPSRNASQIGAPVPAFDPTQHGLEAGIFEGWDPVAIFTMVAAIEAEAESKIENVDSERAGVCIGTAVGGIEAMEMAYNDLAVPEPNTDEAPEFPRLAPRPCPGSMFAAYSCCTPSSLIASRFGLRGPVTCISTGCTAGVDAIGYALDTIRHGDADLMITGGADATFTPLCLTAFDVIRAITRRNDDPSHASRPFERDRSGFLLAEGAGIVVLESLEHARRRGAPILAEVVGYGTNCNAHHMTGMHESGELLAVSIERALEDAGLEAGAIDYINAHGSSTPQNDRAETAAYKRVFGPAAAAIPISSTKSVTGHPLGAASALELIVSTLAIRQAYLPPTANLFAPCDDCDLDYVPHRGRSHEIHYVLSNASGFGGLHSAVILGEVGA